MIDNNSHSLALVSIMVGLESAHAFSATMPSFFTIDTFAKDGQNVEGKIAALRGGYLPAVAISLSIGYVSSAIMRSFYPLLSTIIMSTIMIAFYEYAIRRERVQ